MSGSSLPIETFKECFSKKQAWVFRDRDKDHELRSRCHRQVHRRYPHYGSRSDVSIGNDASNAAVTKAVTPPVYS